MGTIMRTRVGVLACMGLLLACGDIKEVSSDGGPEPDAAVEPDAAPPGPCDPGGEPTLDEGYDCMVQSFCTFISRCGPAFTALTVDECMRFSLNLFDVDNVRFHRELVREAIEQGTVDYHPELVADCFTTISELECPYLAEHSFAEFDFATFCPIFTGTVAEGDPCFTLSECAEPGAVCVKSPDCEDTPSCCAGVCSPVIDVAGACGVSAPCHSGDFCVNGACAGGAEGDPCVNTSHCDRGFWCDGETCQPEIESGADCSIDDQCPGPETCVFPPDSKLAACARSDRPDDECDENCFGLQCVSLNPGVEVGVCIPFGSEEGADCTEAPCRRTFTCNQATNQCERLGDLGAECVNTFSDCQPGFFCDNEISGDKIGACSDRIADGEPCTGDEQCQSDTCGGEGPFTCQPYPGCYE